MGNAIHQVREYVAEMIGATRRVFAPVALQSRNPELQAYPEARWVIESLARMLESHVTELTEHLHRLGGGAPVSEEPREPVGHASIAKALRDDYSALSLAHAGATMLETNARALGYSSTAALARRHREEISTMLLRLRELVAPENVKGEIQGLNTAV
jgi:hypothetical protein